jgi:hypothetical protein
MIMRKHCGNCANHRKETNAFSEECGKCVSARLENGEMADPSHWREKPQTNADRIRAMRDEELAKILNSFTSYFEECNRSLSDTDCHDCELCELCSLGEGKAIDWLKQPAEVE